MYYLHRHMLLDRQTQAYLITFTLKFTPKTGTIIQNSWVYKITVGSKLCFDEE